MLDIKKLAAFYYTAKLGSQVRAAGYLKITQGSIASHIRNLEKDLGTSLMEGRSHLTETGHALFKYLSIYIPQMEEIEEKIRSKQVTYQPQLVIGSTPGICGDWLNNFVPLLLEQEKNVQVVIRTYQLGKDLKKSTEECDVIISDSFYNHMERKKLHAFKFGLYASKEYIKKHGLPKTPADLDNHRLIEFISDPENPFITVESLLHTDSPKARNRAVLTNNSIGESHLINKGAGIGCITIENKNLDRDNLVHIDIGVPDITVEMFYYYKRNAPKSNPLILKFYDIIKNNKEKLGS